jgi:very-short-patch-repair endonuclease
LKNGQLSQLESHPLSAVRRREGRGESVKKIIFEKISNPEYTMVYQRRLTPIQVSRELRRNMTPSEKILWEELRNRRLGGLKFLRQHPVIYDASAVPVKFYVLDFYCDSRKVAIELEGAVHKVQENYDLKRINDLNQVGIKVLRIQNGELKDIEEVKRRILNFMDY